MRIKKAMFVVLLILILVLVGTVGPCVADVVRYQFYDPEEHRFYHMAAVPVKCNKMVPFVAGGGRMVDFLFNQGWGYWESNFDN